MRGAFIRLLVGKMAEDPEKHTRILPAIMLTVIGVLLALGGLMYGLSPGTLNGFLEGAESPYALLEAWDKWYGTMAGARMAGRIIVAVCCVSAVITARRSLAAVAVAVVISLFGFLVCDLMYVIEDIPKLREMVREDMEQIEADRLETVEVYLDGKTERDGLPGPYAEGQQEPFLVYWGIGEATEYRWAGFRVPETLDFTPDAGKTYDDSESMEWNQENARMYTITYTTNFGVVTSIEPTAP